MNFKYLLSSDVLSSTHFYRDNAQSGMTATRYLTISSFFSQFDPFDDSLWLLHRSCVKGGAAVAGSICHPWSVVNAAELPPAGQVAEGAREIIGENYQTKP